MSRIGDIIYVRPGVDRDIQRYAGGKFVWVETPDREGDRRYVSLSGGSTWAFAFNEGIYWDLIRGRVDRDTVSNPHDIPEAEARGEVASEPEPQEEPEVDFSGVNEALLKVTITLKNWEEISAVADTLQELGCLIDEPIEVTKA